MSKIKRENACRAPEFKNLGRMNMSVDRPASNRGWGEKRAENTKTGRSIPSEICLGLCHGLICRLRFDLCNLKRSFHPGPEEHVRTLH